RRRRLRRRALLLALSEGAAAEGGALHSAARAGDPRRALRGVDRRDARARRHPRGLGAAMKHWLLRLEPVIWLLFGQGILVGTILLTGWGLGVGLLLPLRVGPEGALALARAHPPAPNPTRRPLLPPVPAPAPLEGGRP